MVRGHTLLRTLVFVIAVAVALCAQEAAPEASPPPPPRDAVGPAFPSPRPVQTRNDPPPRPVQTRETPVAPDPGLLKEINQIRAIDNHAHPPALNGPNGEPDEDYDALPCDPLEPTEAGLMFREDNPVYIKAW